MSRTSVAGTMGRAIALAGGVLGAGARADDTPPLLPPADAPATAKPVTPTVRDPLKPSTNLLVRPRRALPTTALPSPPAGAASPFSPAPRSAAAPTELPVFQDAPPSLDGPGATAPSLEFDAPPSLDGPPPLDGPGEVRSFPERRPRASTSVGISTRRLGSSPRDVPAETLPTLPLDAPPSLSLEATPTLTREPSQYDARNDGLEPLPDDPNPRRDGVIDRIEPELPKEKKNPTPPPPRRRGIFGLFAPNREPEHDHDRDEPKPRSSIRVDPRDDPAADASLRRKIEAKVREAVGNRAEDIDVRVVDRNVVIKAKVDKFWNRRGVKRTIENLPALAGYRARVEIDD